MNQGQRLALSAAGIIILLLCLFPPFEIGSPLNDAVVFPHNTLADTFRRDFILSQPKITLTAWEKERPKYATARWWKTNQLFDECLLVIGIAGAFLLILSDEFGFKMTHRFAWTLAASFLVLLFGMGLFGLWFGWLGHFVSFLLRLVLVVVLLLLVFGFFTPFMNVVRRGAIWVKGVALFEFILLGVWMVASLLMLVQVKLSFACYQKLF